MTGIAVGHNEVKAARCFGFDDLVSFREYLCSHVFLQYIFQWTKVTMGPNYSSPISPHSESNATTGSSTPFLKNIKDPVKKKQMRWQNPLDRHSNN